MITYARSSLAVALTICAVLHSGRAIAQDSQYAIDPQPLPGALQEFAEQSGYQVIYRPEIAVGLDSAGAQHAISGDETIRELLKGTGLRHEFVNERTITIRQADDDGQALVRPVNMTNLSNSSLLLAQADTVARSTGSATSDARGPDESARSAGIMEEITVTARKKAEGIQDVPIAISAFTAEQLEDAHITNLDQIAPLTPGLFFGKFNESRPQIYIRGVGSRQFDVGAEGSVGVFIDEVYVGRFSAGLSGLGDIERVEILKGPQGTLYGRNTIGGAINVITKKPTEEPYADVEIGVGNLNYVTGQGALSGPLGDSVSGRLSFFYRDRDGYVTNLATGTEHNGLNQFSLRGKLLFTPTDDLDIGFTADYNRSDPEGGLQGEYVGGLPVLATPGFLPPPITTPDRFDEIYNTDSAFDRDIYTLTLRADWRFDIATLTSISAYSDVDMFEARDLDSTQVDGIEHITDEESEQFTQEFRLSSTSGGWFTFDDRVEWILGFYYLREEPIRRENLRGGLDSVFSRIAASIDAGGPPAPIVPGQMFIDNFLTVDVETTSVAFFGESTIDLTDRFALTVGARYTHDEKDAVYTGMSNRDFVPPIILPFQVEMSPSWYSFDPKVTLEFSPTDDLMTYFVYSQGFKSGGFQFAKFNAVEAQEIFDPETVETFEVGLKSTWFDQRLRLNANVFHYDYSDLQVAKTTTGVAGAPAISTINAAAATVKGFELDSSLGLTDDLNLHIGYAYLDATYDEYIFDDTLDFSGNDLVRAPEHTFNATLDYARNVGTGLLGFRADYSWTDEYFFEPDQGLTIGTTQDDYGLVNAAFYYEQGPWRYSVWGKNLTDEVYRTTTLSFGPPSPNTFTMEYLGLPRTYGITVGWTFE